MSEIKTVLTTKMWVTVVVLSILMGFIGVLSAPFAPVWAWSTLFGTATGPVIGLFVILLTSKASKPFSKLFSPQKLAILYTVFSMSLAFCWSMIPYGILHNAALTRLVGNEPYTSSIAAAWVFGPSDPEVVKFIQTGGASVPWGDWSPFTAWWVAYCIFWLLFWVGWMSLLQERWIEVEKLPFSFSLTGTMQIELTASEEEKQGDSRLKFFLLGFVLGALVIIPAVAHALVPWIPDLWGWASPPYETWWLGVLNAAGVPATKIIPVWCFIAINPMIYALFYLFPLKILFSMWFFDIVAILIPAQIAWYMGYYSGIQESGWRAAYLVAEEPFKWNAVWMGIFIGLILTWFALNTSYMKSLFRKPVDAARKAMPHMLGWSMILASTVALIVLLIVAGINPVGSLLIVFTMWLLYLSSVRAYGFASVTGTAMFCPIDFDHLSTFTKYVYYPGITVDNVTTEYTTTMMITNRFTGEILAENNTNWGLAFAVPLSYKVGYDTGTHPRDITKVILVVGIISAIIGFPTAIWFDYTFGTLNTPMQMFDAWWIWVFPDVNILGTGLPASEPIWPWLLAGILLSAVLSFLNLRYIWWPIDPAGVAMGINYAGSMPIFPALFGWVVKTLVVRTGGTRLNDRVATPIAVGVLVGYWVLLFFGAFLGLVRFFMPA